MFIQKNLLNNLKKTPIRLFLFRTFCQSLTWCRFVIILMVFNFGRVDESEKLHSLLMNLTHVFGNDKNAHFNLLGAPASLAF